MADTTALKNRINAAIKANDNQEITGPVLQQSLLDIVDELNNGTEVEASTCSNADATLQQNITAEKNRAEAAENAIKDSLIPQQFSDVVFTNPSSKSIVPRRIGDTSLNTTTFEVWESVALANDPSSWVRKSAGKYGGTSITDFNSPNLSGVNTALSTALNAPNTDENWYCLHMNSNNGVASAVQIAIGFTTGKMYQRLKINSTYGNWDETHEQIRSQNTNTSPSSKLLDDELTNICGTEINISGFIDVSGVHRNDSTRVHSDYLRISGNTNINILAESTNEYVNFISFYDENKTYISGISNNQTTISAQIILSENIPANTTYIRVSTGVNIQSKSFVKFDSIQSLIKSVEENNINYKFDIENELYNKVDKVFGKNLFDKNSPDILQGKYLDDRDVLNNSESYLVSAYIRVKPNTAYSLNFSAGGGVNCIYNKNKELISFTYSKSITIPENGYYIRLTAYIANIDVLQFEEGSISTYYEPFTDYNKFGLIAKQVPDRETTCILPKKMYFVKGKQSCIYYENVLLKNLNDPTTLYVDKGINYNRQVTFNFATASNSQLMHAQVVRSLKNGILKSITYDVIDPAANSGKTINVLHIGDSFTDIGTWVKETKTLLESQGVTYNLIGTCGNSTFRAEGLSGGILDNTFLNSSGGFGRKVQITGVTVLPSTTYPGRTYRDSNGVDWSVRSGKIDRSGNGYMVVTRYGAVQSDFANFPSSGILTKQDSGEGDATISYSNPTTCYFNPFINPSTGLLDIGNYITTWGLSVPNIVIMQFLWNDLGEWSTDAQISSLVTKYKVAIDHIHSAYPNSKIIISIQPMGSINGNRDWNGKKYTVLRFSELMLTQFEDDTNYNTWVKIAPSYAFVDLVYGWAGGVNVVPCERYSSITEPSGGDGVHPATVGMQQIADCVSQVVSAII